MENYFWGGSDVPDDTLTCNFEALKILSDLAIVEEDVEQVLER